MTHKQTFNPWGPCVWEEGAVPRPWHNLPPAIGAISAEKNMQGLAVGFAFAEAERAFDVPALAKAAYAAWHEGCVGAAFTARAKEMAAEFAEEEGLQESHLAVLLPLLAEAVLPFGGGVILAQGLMFLSEDHPEFDALWGAPPAARTLEGAFAPLKELLAMWAEAWQHPCAVAEKDQGFINQLAALTPQDLAEMDPVTLGDLCQTHLIQFMRRFFNAPTHVMDPALDANVARHTRWLKGLALAEAFDAFGAPTSPDPLGLQQQGLLQKVALEGVYLPPLPRFMDGHALAGEALEAMCAQQIWRTLAEGLHEIFNSVTFQRLPAWQGVALPPLSRRAVLEHFIYSTRRNAIGGHN